MNTSDKTERASPFTPFDTAIQAPMAGLEKCVEAGSNMLSGIAALNGEILNFMAKRLQTDCEANKAVAHCRDLQELQKLQSAYLSKAASDYTEEGRKLMESATKIAEESAAPFRQ